MPIRLILLLVLLAVPAAAQPIAAPDCTVEADLASDLTLQVRYHCRTTGPLTFAPDGQRMGEHVSGLTVAGGEASYRFDLKSYARSVDSTSAAVLRGNGVLATLSSWLLQPRGYERAPIIDIRMRTADGLAFATGLPRVGDAWRLAGTSVGFAGYTALGRFSLTEIAVPAPGSLRAGAARQEGVLRLAILDGVSGVSGEELVDWVRRTAEAESNYWQGFTAKQMMVGLVPMAGKRGVGFGRTVSGGGATVMVEIGVDTERRRLFNDWVLVHELVHPGMPYIGGRATWLMEGAATYVEPIIRARAGWKTEEEVWMEWVKDMPQGAQAVAAGLQNASGRANYWAGATFMLLADLGIRRTTNGAKGLEDCLGGALWSGLDSPKRVGIAQDASACDQATGTTVVRDLIERHFARAEPVDLTALWTELGVSRVGGRIALDDAAPHAQWRKMIVFGNKAAKRVKLPWES